MSVFFVESGLIERVGVGYKATAPTIAYHQAGEWDDKTPGHKLAPAVRETWFWKALAPRLSLKSMPEDEAVRLLAEGAGNPDKQRFGPQLEMLLGYLDLSGLTVREGTVIRKGPTASAGGEAPPPPAIQGLPYTSQPIPVMPGASPPVIRPGITFDASISISMEEIQTWSPAQMTAFFAGMAQVIAAKAGAVNHGGQAG